jgi:quinol monooxygenase YgiN
MIKVVAKSVMQKEKLPEVLKLFEELVAKTRQEKGCVAYDLFEAASDPATLTIIEEWESQARLDAHTQTEHFKTLFPEINKSCSVPFEITLYNKKI